VTAGNRIFRACAYVPAVLIFSIVLGLLLALIGPLLFGR
jgi:hypothetical protein